jgi:hypothetical protein
MKFTRYFWVVLTILLISVGAFLLFDSMRQPGQFLDASVLPGATLTAAGVATASVALDHHRNLRAFAKNMGWHSKRKDATDRSQRIPVGPTNQAS